MCVCVCVCVHARVLIIVRRRKEVVSEGNKGWAEKGIVPKGTRHRYIHSRELV